jgi:hypothetical protein
MANIINSQIYVFSAYDLEYKLTICFNELCGRYNKFTEMSQYFKK